MVMMISALVPRRTARRRRSENADKKLSSNRLNAAHRIALLAFRVLSDTSKNKEKKKEKGCGCMYDYLDTLPLAPCRRRPLPGFPRLCCLHLVPKHFVSRPSCVGLSLSPSLDPTNLVSTQIKIATPRVSSLGPSSTSSNLSQTHVLMPQRFSLSSPTKYGPIFFANKPCESARCTPSNLLLFSPF